MSKVNWAPQLGDDVIATADYRVYCAASLGFDTPIKGQRGYQLIYRPTDFVQAEGVDIVVAVAGCYAAQRVLDKVKAKPELLSQDPETAVLGGFFGEPESDLRN